MVRNLETPACHRTPTSHFPLPTSYFLLPTSYFLLPTSYFLLPTLHSPHTHRMLKCATSISGKWHDVSRSAGQRAGDAGADVHSDDGQNRCYRSRYPQRAFTAQHADSAGRRHCADGGRAVRLGVADAVPGVVDPVARSGFVRAVAAG